MISNNSLISFPIINNISFSAAEGVPVLCKPLSKQLQKNQGYSLC